jgi:hypothetical protein
LVLAVSVAGCGGGAQPDATPDSAHLASSHSAASRYVAYQRSEIRYDDHPVRVIGVRGSRLYALSEQGRLVHSDSLGESWVEVNGKITDADDPARGLVFMADRVFAYTKYGRILSSPVEPIGPWTDVSVPRDTAPFLPADTTWRPDIMAANAKYLFYGNCGSGNTNGAHVYRSADEGRTWEEVLSVPEPLARHVHSVRVNPRNDNGVFVTLGDIRPGATGIGLYYSVADGRPGSFVHLSSNTAGIDLAFPAGADRLFIEGDGPSQTLPFVLSYPWSEIERQAEVKVQISHPEGWSGTTLAMTTTPSDDLLWVSTTENGVHGQKEGVWLARRPSYSVSLLLEDITDKRAEWPVLGKTYVLGDYLFNGSQRIYVSDAQASCAIPRWVLQGIVRSVTCIEAPS